MGRLDPSDSCDPLGVYAVPREPSLLHEFAWAMPDLRDAVEAARAAREAAVHAAYMELTAHPREQQHGAVLDAHRRAYGAANAEYRLRMHELAAAARNDPRADAIARRYPDFAEEVAAAEDQFREETGWKHRFPSSAECKAARPRADARIEAARARLLAQIEVMRLGLGPEKSAR